MIRKHIFHCLALACALFCFCAAASAGDIPKSTTIYLDVTQHWCCHKAYYIYFSGSRTGQPSGSYKMSPVAGIDGVYQYTTTSQDRTQDNIRFCYSNSETEAYYTNQLSNHTEDARWSSSSKPYYVIDSENGQTGHWAAQPSVSGTSALTDVLATLSYNCADNLYNAELLIRFDGAPCGLKITSSHMADAKQVKTPQSPWSYTLTGLAVAEGDPFSITVGLYSDVACTALVEEKTYNLTAPAPVCEKTTSITLCQGEELQLSSSVNAEFYRWTTGTDTIESEVMRSYISTPEQAGTYRYSVTAYKTVVNAAENLMVSGGFENVDAFSSDYVYVGIDPNEYYDSHAEASNLWALSHDASYFSHYYEPVLPHSGSWFGLFDAGKSGYAWKATSLDNPDLVIFQDSIYYFSYWAANPNADNVSPAKLKFVLGYTLDGVTTEVDLGEPYTLPDDNEWHQQTVVWRSPVDCADVYIGLYDLNDEWKGNDFCLDDIMFQTVSYAVSRVAFTDNFEVTVNDCSVTPPEPCTVQIYRKWNDFLFVDNKEGNYHSFQWYKNGEPIQGATGQYYRADPVPSPSDEFYVVLNNESGDVESCHTTFDAASPSAVLYPATNVRTLVASRLYPISTHINLLVKTYSDGSVEAEKQLVY